MLIVKYKACSRILDVQGVGIRESFVAGTLASFLDSSGHPFGATSPHGT